MSVLFLNTIKRPGRRAAEELVFAFAAGLAMLFAVFFTLAAQVRYSQASMQFVALVVVSYMLKDRLKEWARRRTASILGKFLYDRVTTIGDPVSRESVGALKEKVDYIQKKDVPSWLMDMRKTDDLFAVSVGELSESVLRYRKAITLDGDELPKVASGLSSGVTDIIRLSVGSFLVDMDDPEYALDYVDAEDLKPGKLRAAKSYVVDVGLRYVLDDGNAFEERRQVLRLTLDRNGIRKLEHIGGVPLVEPPRPSIV